jgi:hypothetical protein
VSEQDAVTVAVPVSKASVSDQDAATVALRAAPLEVPPPFTPRARREADEPHVIRNVILSAASVALVLIAMFIAIQKYTKHPPPAAVAQTDAVPKEAIPPPPDTPIAKPDESKIPGPPPPEPVAPSAEPVAAKAQPVRTAQQKPSGAVDFQLTTSPADAIATFDGDPATACKAPCTIGLASGRHTFVVKHPGFREEHRIIEVPRDAGMIVDLVKQMGSLSLITNPSGLTVFIDGKEQPQKTPANLSLAIGSHRVQVMKGADKQEFTVDIRDGLLSSKFIEWTQ